MMKQQKGFTLAETLITLTILGVVAAITVPSLINKYSESANRTKVKKSMATYEKALNQMIIENDLKGSVQTWNEGVANCGNTTGYFKKIQGDGCYFQTADKVWWDISDIEHPVISLTDEITAQNSADIKAKADSLADDKTSFVMVGEIKDGIVRINDKGGVAAADEDYVDKLYAFINNEKDNAGGGGGTQLPEFLADCDKESDDRYVCNGIMFLKKEVEEKQCVTYGNNQQSCADPGYYWVSDNPVSPSVYGADASDCTKYNTDACNSYGGDYYAAAKYYCESRGTSLATFGELVSLGYTSGYLWASDEYESPYDAYYLDSGHVSHTYSDDGGRANNFNSVVCVGN